MWGHNVSFVALVEKGWEQRGSQYLVGGYRSDKEESKTPWCLSYEQGWTWVNGVEEVC